MPRKKKTPDQVEHETLMANVRALLDTRHGKDFVWYVLELADIYGHQFTGNSATYFNEGRRSVGIELIHLINESDPTAYAKLLLAKIKEEEVT